MPAEDNSSVIHVADRHQAKQPQIRTAGEVRFIKDKGEDTKQWGWGNPGPSNREIGEDFEFDPRNLKPLAKVLKATLSAMGHALVAYDGFTRVKSSTISPDGSLGGKGYIQKIPDMRKAYMNVVEALSALSDTLHDEMQAPHWNPAIQEQSKRERDDVKNIMTDVEDIMQDPEAWAQKEEGGDGEGGEDGFPPPKGKFPPKPPAGGGGDDGSDEEAGAIKLAQRKTAGNIYEQNAIARVAARHMARSAQ